MNDAAPSSATTPTAKVLHLIHTMHGLVERGKTRGNVTDADWEVLGDIVEFEDFERIGPFHDALDWAGYCAMLTGWVNHTEGWDPVIKRTAEAPGTVFAQCEEMLTQGDEVVPFYSLSMYDFNAAGKIHRISVYMQQDAPPDYSLQGK